MSFEGEDSIPAQGRPRSALEQFGTPTPKFRLHRDRPAKAQLRKVRNIVDRYGRAQFVTYGLSGRRLCYKLRDLLPGAYQATVEEPCPERGGPGALYRWRRYETRLWVTRIGGPDRQPRSEHPHQRALDSLNRPNPPEQDPPGHQPGI